MQDEEAMKQYVLKDSGRNFYENKVNNGTEVSRFTVSHCLKEFELKTCSSAMKPTARKNKWKRLSFVCTGWMKIGQKFVKAMQTNSVL